MVFEKKESSKNLPEDGTPKKELEKYKPKHADKKLDTSESDSKKADDILKKSMWANWLNAKDYSKGMWRKEDSKIDSTKKGMWMIINDEKYKDTPKKIKIEWSEVNLLMNDACKTKLENFWLIINSDSKNNWWIEVKWFNGKKFTLNNQTYIAEMSIYKDKNENNESVQINILNKDWTREKYSIKKNWSYAQLIDSNTWKILIN